MKARADKLPSLPGFLYLRTVNLQLAVETPMPTQSNGPFRRFQELQEYVGWTPEDAQRMSFLGALVEPRLPALQEVHWPLRSLLATKCARDG